MPPHIRYYLYIHVFEKPEEFSSMEDVKKQCQQSGEFRKLLRRQDNDGLWPPRRNFRQEKQQYGIQFFSQVLALHHLLDLGATRDLPEIRQGIVALMKMQREDGKFPLFYQHQGYALWVLMRYGMQGNPFVDRGLRWLLRRQRDDGGWLHTVQIPKDHDQEDHPSCIWTTCHVVWPMVQHNVYYKDERVVRGIDYLLDNYLEPNYTNFFHPGDAWNYLYVGHDETGCFRGGTLKVVEIAVAAGFDRTHKVIKKAANWLRDQQLENGLFPAVAGKDTQGDYMVTVRILNVLKNLYPETVVLT
ncbi:MAG TPA: prenyltransferase/squalene oxidase repeat-containing protein [bacterium]|nr:prenyltransferase/squalene oxidase repeat-containing protein [bacterium]